MKSKLCIDSCEYFCEITFWRGLFPSYKCWESPRFVLSDPRLSSSDWFGCSQLKQQEWNGSPSANDFINSNTTLAISLQWHSIAHWVIDLLRLGWKTLWVASSALPHACLARRPLYLLWVVTLREPSFFPNIESLDGLRLLEVYFS